MTVHRFTKYAYHAALVGAIQLGLTAGPAVVTGHADVDQLTTWCGLYLGQSKDEVMAAMGTPNGHRAESLIATVKWMHDGATTAEWDPDGAILFAAFDKDNTTIKLLSYDAATGAEGSVPPAGLGCDPWRAS
ncbi:hypothetical protein ACFXPR_08180 [Nocardia tengchongensis]|uniref:hypothetical protein n=1 Tax=Nocardia tengchongensis TaxID=2055889 RepID=UPI0036A0EAE6